MRRGEIAGALKHAGAPLELIEYYERKFSIHDAEPIDAEDFAGILRSFKSWLEANFQPAVLPSICDDC